MSAEATDSEVDQLIGRLRDELIVMGGLTQEGAERIDEAMRTRGLGFGDAAIELGLVTPEDLAKAIRASLQVPPKATVGIIEGVLHTKSLSRNLPVEFVRKIKPGPSLILVRHPDSTYSEQIRTLRTELLLPNGASRGGKLIAIVSPCQGEGRTQLCAELAIAFSQLGQGTLLVDADLRRPRVHALFQSGKTLGLGQALASGGVPELLSVEGLPHLSVLIAGPSLPNPLELLTKGHFQRQMSELRKRYSTIIVDTPPITEFADGLAIASFAEQVIIVGRSGSTPHKNMRQMLRRMGDIQSRIVGAVINSF